nr:MAG TPA: hypothetical protein [Crassvirales sp.]
MSSSLTGITNDLLDSHDLDSKRQYPAYSNVGS